MLTRDQSNELSRLASLWATARCRKALVNYGGGALHETLDGVISREIAANKEFHEYLRSLTEITKC